MMSLEALIGQIVIGLINGSFYALLSLGLAIIFGLLNVVNFTHGVQYMLGALGTWLLLRHAGLGYWWALVLAPLGVGLIGVLTERLLLRRVYHLDHLYGLVLTFGLALIIESLLREQFGAAGLPYGIPPQLRGGVDLGVIYLPIYRIWVIGVALTICFGTWFAIEKTKLGAKLRAATENPRLLQSFGVNVPMLITLTYAGGVGLAALAGVMAAPIYPVTPLMGANIMTILFAVVVIGGMGSIMGAILAGFGLGIIEGLTKFLYPPAATLSIFLMMAIVLLWRPTGLMGQTLTVHASSFATTRLQPALARMGRWLFALALAAALVAPFFVYPLFLAKALCFALFAAAFGLLAGYVGLLSFGHAAYFGAAAYITAWLAKSTSLPPELSILAGVGVAAALGLVFGALAVRRQGIYFAMVTMALAQIVYFAAIQLPFTGGEDGIQNVPRGRLFGLVDLENPVSLYFTVLAIFGIGIGIIVATIRSPFGQVLKSISQNEARAISLGYETQRYKLIAFVLSASLSGLAGATKALVMKLASVSDVHFALSGEVLLMALMGGLGTITGPILGAFALTGIDTYLASTGAWVRVIQGTAFVVCVLAFRRGLIGGAQALLSRLMREAGGSNEPSGVAHR